MSDEEKVEEQQGSSSPWDCEITTLEEGKSWTVGDKQNLICRGDVGDRLEAPIHIEVTAPKKAENQGKGVPPGKAAAKDPNINYTLYILETKQVDNSSADFVVTSYKPGTFKNLKIKLIGKNNKKINVQPMSWEVTSVVTKETKTGFGPTQPIPLVYPWWYWAGLFTLIGLVALIAIGKVLLIGRKKKISKEIKSHATAMGPVNQFYKDIRTLKNMYMSFGEVLTDDNVKEYWEALEYKFELFLIRRFEIPVNSWGQVKVLKSIRKQLGVASSLKLSNQLKRILSEFKKGQKAKAITVEDIEHMEKLCQTYVESVKKIDKGGR